MKTHIYLLSLSLQVCLVLWATYAFGQPVTAFDIYVVDQRTGATTQVTTMEGTGEFNPDWSNDGKYLVHDVAAYTEANVFISQNLYITEVATGISTPLAGGEGGNNAAWSPNGRFIVFDRAPMDAPNPDESLYRVPAAGGEPELIREDAVDPDWSESSQCLVFHQPSDGTIRTLHLRSGQEELVGEGSQPEWSPNGRFIAYANEGDIWYVKMRQCAPDGAPVQVTFHPADDGNPSWTRDSKHLVFYSVRRGNYDLWQILIDDRFPVTPFLFTGLIGANDVDPSSHTQMVAYAGSAPPSDFASLGLGRRLGLFRRLNDTAFPNPFNPSTRIQFELPESGPVTLKVFDLLGKEVGDLISGHLEAGIHSVRFDASNLPSGTYLYRLEAGGESVVRPLVLLK